MAALKFDKQFLQCFWDLAAVDEEVRSKAVASLVHFIGQEKDTGDDSASESESSEAVDPKAARLAYSLKRLVGGLASSRDAARQGFAVALTTLLKTFKEDLSLSEVWEKVESLLNAEGASKQEERDVLFGRLFAILALVRSGRLYTEEGTQVPVRRASAQTEGNSADGSSEASDDGSEDEESGEESEEESGEEESGEEESGEEESSEEASSADREAAVEADGDVEMGAAEPAAPLLVQCIKEALAVADRKIYLREIAFSTIRTLLQDAPAAIVTEVLLPALSSQVNLKLAQMSPDQLALVLVLQQRGIWQHSAGPLPSPGTVKTIGTILASSTHAHPRVHSAWGMMVDMLLQADATSASGTPKKSKKKSSKKDGGDSCALLLHFWLTVVDELLFNSDSANRKYLAFQLVSAIVGRLTAEQITLVFTPNFLRCLITHLSDRSTQLHAAAKATLRSIVKAAEEKEELRMPIALQLLSTERGTISFDQRTKTRAVGTLLGGMDAKEAPQFVEYLIGIFAHAAEQHSSTDEAGAQKFIDSRRIWALNQMLALTKNSLLEKREEWLTILLKFLLKYALFKPSSEGGKKAKKAKKSKKAKNSGKETEEATLVEISDGVRSVCKQRLTTVLGLLDNLPSFDEGTKRRGVTASGDMWVKVATEHYSELAQRFQPVVAISEVQKKLFKKAMAAASSLCPEKSSSIVTLRALEYLLLQLGMLLLSEPEDDEIVQASEDVLECASRLSKTKKKKGAQEGDEGEEDPFMVLVDVMMSLLSRSSAWTKNMVSRAFQGICGELTAEHLAPVFGIIAQAGNEDPDADLSDAEDGDGDDESDESEDDDEEDSDEEMAEVEEESESEGSEEKVPEGELDNDINLDDADPAQLKELDDRLTAMFKDMRARKTEEREFQQSAVTLRLRAIELLDVFSRRVRSPVLLSLFRPLYLCIRTTDDVEPQQAVYSKALALFKRMCKGKAPSAGSLDKSTAAAEYKKIYGQLEDFTEEVITRGKHLKGLKKPSKMSLEAAQEAVIFFTKASLHAAEALPEKKRKNVLPNMTAYMQLMDKLVTDYAQSKKSIISDAFLEDYVRRFPTLSWKLSLVFLFQAVQRGRNEFIKQSGCNILASILQQHATIKGAKDTTLAASIAPKASAAFLEALKNADNNKRRVSILMSIKTSVTALQQLGVLEGWNTETYTSVLEDMANGSGNSQRLISLSNDVLIKLGANPLSVLAKRGRSEGPPAKKKKTSAVGTPASNGKAPAQKGKKKRSGPKKSVKSAKANTKS